MSMTISGLSEAQLDEMVIGSLQANLPLISAFSTQLQGSGDGGFVVGNSYVVPLIGALTAGTKTAGTLFTEAGSVTGVSVTTNSFKAVSWSIAEGAVSSKLLGNYWAKQIGEGIKTIAKTVVDGALALVTATNYGSTSADVIEDADFDIDTVIGLRSIAKAKLKGSDGSVILNSVCASKYLGLNMAVLASANADGKNPFAGSALPGTLFGYNTYEYSDLPDNSERLVGCVIGKGAIAVAAGAPEQLIQSGDGDCAYRRIIEDPESGLSVQYTEAITAGGKIQGECAIIYGVAKGQNAVVRLVTPAPTPGL